MAPASDLRRALLLLPPAASTAYPALKAAHGSCLAAVLAELADHSRKNGRIATVDVAVVCSQWHGQADAPRAALYPQVHRLVAGLYKLLCITLAKLAADALPDPVDARVVLVSDRPLAERQAMLGPLVDLRVLACCSRAWQCIFSIASEQGESALNQLLSYRRPSGVLHVRRIVAELDAVLPRDASPPGLRASCRDHASVAVGGTFDHLHTGHKLLLTMAAFVLSPQAALDGRPRTLTIGITGDALLAKKQFADRLEGWHQRQQAVHDFLWSILHFGPRDGGTASAQEDGSVHVTGPDGLVIRYVELHDPFGPTVTDAAISALVVSRETRAGGQAANEQRASHGWPPLELFEVDVLDARDGDGAAADDDTFQSKLSSTETRRRLAASHV